MIKINPKFYKFTNFMPLVFFYTPWKQKTQEVKK